MDEVVIMIIMGLGSAAIGLFSLMGALKNWEWFFNNYKARGLVAIFGRNGARIFYGILGAIFILIGVGVAIGGLIGLFI